MNSYKSNFDSLGQRIQDRLTSESYVTELIDALIFSVVFSIPFIVYFWSM